MKRHASRNSHRDERQKPSRNENSDAVLHASRVEEERRQRRREWEIGQEKMARHDRLKKKMAMEYEMQRSRNMGLPLPEGRCSRPRRSRSRSPRSRHGRTSEHCTPKVTVLSKKFVTSSGETPFFKGSGVSPKELCKIQVQIRRNIAGGAATHSLKRDIPNKENVVLKRRAGEGSKPIFNREEIKRGIGEIERTEKRSVEIVGLENSDHDLLRSTNITLPMMTPMYYANFQPRPVIVPIDGPWAPIRGPLGGIRCPMMRPLITYPTQSIGIPPDTYGFRLPIIPKCYSKRGGIH